MRAALYLARPPPDGPFRPRRALVMKKILLLYTEIAPYLMAGVERLVKEHGAEVHIVCWPVNKEAPFQFRAMQRIHMYDRTRYDRMALLRFVETLRPDVILASGWIEPDYMAACAAARKRGIPTVMAMDPQWTGSLKQWATVALRRSVLSRTFSHAWVPGHAQARYARRLGFRADRIMLGCYTADLDLFAPLADRFLAAKAAHFPHRFLSVARYLKIKGHPYMEEAFAELCDAGEAGDWELWCIGTGDLFPSALQHPRVKHLGFVQADQVWKYQEQCGVFVLASLYEAWGVAVHEHAAAGFPLILSNVVGAHERFLEEGRNGWRFRAGDKESLKRAYRAAIAVSDAELLAMGRRSAELGRSWGPAQWAATLMQVIDQGHG